MRILAAGWIALAFAGTATAAPKDAKLAKQKLASAQDAEKRADANAARGKLAEARELWTKAAADYAAAIEAGDDLSIDVALAGVEQKLGKLDDAYRHLQLAIHADSVKPDVAKKAQAKLDDLTANVGTVKLAIVPDGAQISVGGSPVGTSPLPDPLLFAPGNYTATISAAGYQPRDVELKLQAGSEIEKKVTLEPVPIAVSTAPVHDAPPPDAPAPKRSLVPLIVGGGLTVGFTAVAVVTGIAAIHQHDTFVSPTTDPTDRGHAQSTGRLEAHLTDGFIVGAVAAAGVTAGWYYFTSDRESAAKVGVAPWVQSDAGGVVAAGSF